MISKRLMVRGISLLTMQLFMLPVNAAHAEDVDLATRFGALESVLDVSLSPDGSQLAFIDQGANRKRQLYVVGTADAAEPRLIR